MRYVTEFRDPAAAQALITRIAAAADRPVKLMEVCGTHTMAIAKYGLREVLPPEIDLLTGPGCPVCVTANADLDFGIALADVDEVIVTSFGDMFRVPGSKTSLQEQRARGRDVRLVYSPTDAVKLAREHPDRRVVFLGVGFETTAPAAAAAALMARDSGLDNFFLHSSFKTMPLALKALIDLGEVDFQGYILPGHVSVILGVEPYRFLAEDYGVPGVIAGFEPVDVLQAILMLVEMIAAEEPDIGVQYKRGVRLEGNPQAKAVLDEVFEPCDADWRGIGVIPGTGLAIRDEYAHLDAAKEFDIVVEPSTKTRGCRCGEVLRGLIRPDECKLFGAACTPANPIGPCMVSSEGACAAYFKYGT